ncbi:MAG: SRPBCC family protein [Actinomycetota bacterium]|nr:SRPBCC family protein [Actinomycetota bacterium]
MSTVSRHVNVDPAGVFAVLAEGWFYSNWVVGTSHVRSVAADWPAVGSRLHHASGVWPAVARDETVVEEVESDRRLVLLARGRPLGEARVVIELVAEDGDAAGSAPGGTTITMIETPVAGPGKWLHNPLTEALLTRRNVESLARLAALVERRTECPD